MTRELSECLTFTVPLGSEPHRKAQQFTNSKRSQQSRKVYLNTLAISAVEFYVAWDGDKTGQPVLVGTQYGKP